jgi:hypothetical protein
MPQIRLTHMAVERGRRRTGTAKVRAKRHFARNVAMVATQISLIVWTFSASSET